MNIEKEFIQSFFGHYKNKIIMEYLLNMLFVYENKRSAFLIETANTNFNDEYWLPIDYLIKILQLHKTKIFSDPNYPRFLIYKSINRINKIPETDIELGKILGMTYLNDDYCDYRLYRSVYRIYEINNKFELYVEVAIKNNDLVTKNNIDKIKEFNTVIHKYKLPYRIACIKEYDHGTYRRYEELKNKNYKYMINHTNDYINDLLNWNNDIVIDNDITQDFFTKNYNKLVDFYNKINQDEN
jgi:hypothetical protein